MAKVQNLNLAYQKLEVHTILITCNPSPVFESDIIYELTKQDIENVVASLRGCLRFIC
jgi:hypothetical protein